MRFLAALIVLLLALLLPSTAHAAWVWPLSGELIGTYRNGDDPYAGGQHRGIDIAGAVGARVVAAAAGMVRYAGTAGSSGLTVAVRTADGFDTSYLHLSSLAVREGDGVSAGDTLGAVGTSGRRSADQPHLHFGVREAGSRHAYRDPLDFLPAVPVPPPAGSPDPAPSPLPLPAPRAPSPAPAGGRAPSPQPRPSPERAPRRVPLGGRAPRRVPAAGRAPSPRHAPRPAPSPVDRRVADPGEAHGPQPAGQPHRAPDPLQRPTALPAPDTQATRGAAAPQARPALGPAGRPTAGAESGPKLSAAGPHEPAGRSPDGGGPDVGWVVACVGLLLAAALLGTTEEGRKAAGTGRRGLVRLLRPLTSRG